MEKDKQNHTEEVKLRFTPKQKERLIEIMLEHSYFASLATFLRYIILEKFNIKHKK